MKIPNDIWATPKITDIFILNPFVNVSAFEERVQVGSTPIAYTQLSVNTPTLWPSLVITSQHVPISKGSDMKSL